MHSHVRTVLVGSALLLAAVFGSPRPAPAQPTPPPGGYLPDTTVIARVDDRLVRVIDFREHYFTSPGDVRPAADSLGRVEFLRTMVRKEIMGSTARKISPPLDFEDRKKIRDYRRVLLLNALYVHAVGDSSTPSAEEIARYTPQFGFEVRVREIRFADPDTAEHVRRLLVDKSITWKDAVKRYSLGDRGPEGEVGWIQRYQVRGQLALEAFSLEPGQISPVIPGQGVWLLVQCAERRVATPPPSTTIRRLVARDIRESKAVPLIDRLLGTIRAREGAVYDTANILWLIGRFREDVSRSNAANGFTLDLGSAVPLVAPSDTGRTLIRSPARRYSVDQFLAAYSAYPKVRRPSATSWSSFLTALDMLFLEPQLYDEAIARGLENDSLVVAETERKTEEMLVYHLYEDSILSRVRIDPAKERSYYEEHRQRFFSVQGVRYAVFVRETPDAADSLLERLRAGALPELVVAADSARGVASGILEHLETDPDVQSLRKLLFEELRPGEATRIGPDVDGNYGVIQLLDFRPSRQMEFNEVVEIVRESVYNIESERLLEAFLDRHASGHAIEARYDLVMRIKLTDPAEDWF